MRVRRSGPPEKPIHVAEIDLAAADSSVSGGGDRPAARVLATWRGLPLGMVQVPLTDGSAPSQAVLAATAAALELPAGCLPVEPGLPGPPRCLAGLLAGLPDDVPRRWPPDTPTLTVTVATRNRPDSLARCLRSVLQAAPPDVMVLVVDNAPDDDMTAAVVKEEFGGDPRVRYLLEPRPGLSVARNRALAEVDTDLLLFTDDDVEVDRQWIARHLQAYLPQPDGARPPACVTGAIFAARLDSAEEIMSDRGIAWSKGLRPARFALDRPPPGVAIFPFSPGLFGAGANFSVRTDVARELGGFDEALGAGSPAKGGEDCDFFVRLVLAGHVLGYQPAAYLWHHHRPSPEAFRRQMRDYGTGLAAWLTKVALDPATRRAAVRRTPSAVRQLARLRRQESGAGMSAGLSLLKLGGALAGPAAYLRGRSRAPHRPVGQ